MLTDNLRSQPRYYQLDALQHWRDYVNNLANTELPVRAMFNMATGSGKTYVMAALMLDLYQRGYRNFVFFVNSTNILEKTRNNFIHSSSSKYLFAPNIIINNRRVEVREVQSFTNCNPDAINIVFTTTQKLHNDLNYPRENALTYPELARQKVVLISDEAHHNNAKMFLKSNISWEETIENILAQNPQTVLLEFTATLDLHDPTIRNKYSGGTLFRYDLRQFREDGYSKDILIHAVDDEMWRRELHAVIISQYRKLVAAENQISLKPVILFKSRTIFENKTNVRDFLRLIVQLTPDKIFNERANATGILQQAFSFFDEHELDDSELCRMLQTDFGPNQVLQIDGGQKISTSLQHTINSLEELQNPIRAIFAVDMLKEGWDVLNLFDIVRLYESRSSRTDTQKTTISEAQLIGRGARYYPFTISDNHDKYRRKFDQQKEHPLRALEQLHYYTKYDIPYIEEIKQVLDESGISNFKNATVSKLPKNTEIEPSNIQIPSTIGLELYSGNCGDFSIFEKSPDNYSSDDILVLKIGHGEQITLNVVYAAMRYSGFTTTKVQMWGFSGKQDFVKALAKITVKVRSCRSEPLSQEQKLQVICKLLELITQDT